MVHPYCVTFPHSSLIGNATVRHYFRALPLLVPVVALFARAIPAQTPASIQRAVNSITADDVGRRIAILADDSMMGRATPSPQLEQVAQYIAGEFKSVGLKPGGDNGS